VDPNSRKSELIYLLKKKRKKRILQLVSELISQKRTESTEKASKAQDKWKKQTELESGEEYDGIVGAGNRDNKVVSREEDGGYCMVN
jgi:hypothetical protein